MILNLLETVMNLPILHIKVKQVKHNYISYIPTRAVFNNGPNGTYEF